MATAAAPVRRGSTAATVAGGALSLAGAGAAGCVAAAHLPTILDMVQHTEVAPAARTVSLVALGLPAAAEAPTELLPAVDPVAVAASATQPVAAPSVAPRATSPERPATAAPAAAEPTAEAGDQDRAGDAGGNDSDATDSSTTDTGDSDSDDATSSSDSDGSDSDGSDSDGSDSDGKTSDGKDSDGSDSTSSDSTSSDSTSSDSTSSDSTSSDSTGSDENGGTGDEDRGPGAPSTESRSGDSTAEVPDRDNGSAASGTSPAGGDGDSGGSSSASGSTSTGGASIGTSLDPRIAPGSAGRPVTGDLPSAIIDTKDWYLTLPTGKEGNPDLVEGSALARYHSQFFQLSPSRDGVVFTAGTGGVTTSGSNYPRSELREMFGSQKASWDGRKGRHTMEIVEAITATPKTKPDVIAGQIHATSDDLMQIHLSGNLLRVKYADGQKFVDLDTNYRLGTMFAVKIESAEGRVKVWYNGQLKADLPISSSTSYFKAGVYTNSNPSKGDKSSAGQVVIRSLAVRHE